MVVPFRFAIVLAAVLLPAAVGAAQPPAEEIAAWERHERQILERLHPVTGEVRLPTARAVLRLGEEYYFLPPDEAKLVLTEGWGNPPELADGVLGMVFPAGRTFADDTWGAVITYEATGYVSDDDAEAIDYAALMEEMQSGEDTVNEERRRAGFPEQHLVGWAEQPRYDRRTHSVVWAQNILFQGSPENTLNYDVRMLGRGGVLSLNMVTTMSKLDETKAAAERFAAAASFEPGARYADYRAGDPVAEYGVAGLVAAGVGAAAAKKAGLFAVLLAFGKKFFVLIFAGIAVGVRWAYGMIRRRREEEEEAGWVENDAPFTDAPEAGADPGHT